MWKGFPVNCAWILIMLGWPTHHEGLTKFVKFHWPFFYKLRSGGLSHFEHHRRRFKTSLLEKMMPIPILVILASLQLCSSASPGPALSKSLAMKETHLHRVFSRATALPKDAPFSQSESLMSNAITCVGGSVPTGKAGGVILLVHGTSGSPGNTWIQVQ